MELYEYPRPANDTGIGIHWSAGYATAIGLSKIRQIWIPEMKALGVKWVKIFNHEGAHDFAELLLAEGFMPIVRIYRAHPNPGRLSVKDLVDVDTFARLGVRYFECNNEPDRDAEWKGGRVPANGLDIAVEDAIADMEAILERDGMPAVPAVSCGSRWDLVGKIVEKGRRDLFDGPVWQAIHNYSRNRPLDYPYDLGNQEGAAYTQRFYQTVRTECPGFDPWNGRSLAQINQMRRDYANPGATVRDDTMCWLAYEFFDARNRRHIGHSIPLLSTENGYLVGEQIDPRYPATTPDLHLAQTLEACRIMMGSSRRFQPAPDYYFCTAFMLIANEQLGSSSNWWEGYAWYSRRWPSGVLPIVKALRAEPKVLRRWQQREPVGARILLHGTVHNAGTRDTLILDRNGVEQARVTIDNFGRYVFPDLLPGSYILRIPNTDFMESVSLTPDQREFVLDLTVPAVETGPSRSVVHGLVRGGAGAVVLLRRTTDGEEWVTTAREDGAYRFIDLAAGSYRARVYPRGAQSDLIHLDGENSADVELAVDGWGYTVRYDPDPALQEAHSGSSRPATVVRCAVDGYKNLTVFVQCGDWQSEPAETGSALDHGEFACEIDITDLLQQHGVAFSAGANSSQAQALELDCTVCVEGVVDADGEPEPLRATISLQGGQIPFVRFIRQTVQAADAPVQSSIVGRVLGEYDLTEPIYVVLTDAQARSQRQSVDETGAFAFHELADGLYSVAVEGYEKMASRSDIALDGANQVQIELVLPPLATRSSTASMMQEPDSGQHRSMIAARVPNGAGQFAKLTDDVGNVHTQMVDRDGTVRFTELPAGLYSLMVEGGHTQEELRVDGTNGCEVLFAPLETSWQAEVSAAQPMPGFSAIRVEVMDRADVPVYLSKEEWEGMIARTGSRPDLGPHALEFSPLQPGYYLVEPDGLGIIADVHLTGLEAVWVTFWQQTLPISPPIVRPLDAPPHAHSANPTSVTDAETDAPVLSKRMGETDCADEHLIDTDGSSLNTSIINTPSFDEPSPDDSRLQEDAQIEPLSAELVHDGHHHGDALASESVAVHRSDEPQAKNGAIDFGAVTDDSFIEIEYTDVVTTPYTASLHGIPGGQDADVGYEDVADGSAEESLRQPDDVLLAQITLDGTHPDTEETDGETIDEKEEQISDTEPKPSDEPSQYLYIGARDQTGNAQTIDDLIAVLRYVAHAQPSIGNDIHAAMQAEQVIVVGDAPADVLDALTEQGVAVEQVSDNIVEGFRRLYHL